MKQAKSSDYEQNVCMIQELSKICSKYWLPHSKFIIIYILVVSSHQKISNTMAGDFLEISRAHTLIIMIYSILVTSGSICESIDKHD